MRAHQHETLSQAYRKVEQGIRGARTLKDSLDLNLDNPADVERAMYVFRRWLRAQADMHRVRAMEEAHG